MGQLLSVTNPKTLKSLSQGYLTVAHHLAPASESGRNFCSHSSAGCRAACLNRSGHGRMPAVQAARVLRSQRFTENPVGYMAALCFELDGYVRQAAKKDLKLAGRMNVVSDLPWENIKCGKHANVFEAYEEIRFYDYTKYPIRLRRRALEIPNYHLTFSLSEDNDHEARLALRAGVNVAVVFRAGEMPEHFWGHEVICGDEDDLRFNDPSPVIVGLTVKSPGTRDSTGFVRSAPQRRAPRGRAAGRRKRVVNR
jgi:hypothetical protein